jgi:hypothetical protein
LTSDIGIFCVFIDFYCRNYGLQPRVATMEPEMYCFFGQATDIIFSQGKTLKQYLRRKFYEH